MITLVLSILTVLAAAACVLCSNQKVALLAAGAMGLFSSAVFISVGAETLAWIQALLSAMLLGAGYVFGITAGEPEERPVSKPLTSSSELVRIGVSALISICFGAMLWSAFHLHRNEPWMIEGQFQENLSELGMAWVQRHFLAVQVVSAMILLTLIGVGAVSRLETRRSNGEDE